jgi:restriction system protein
MAFERNGKPKSFDKPGYPAAPTREQAKRQVPFLRRLFKPSSVDEHFDVLKRHHQQATADVDKRIAERKKSFDQAVQTFEEKKVAFERRQQERNEAIDALRARYENGEPDAIEEHIDLVFQNSQYPDLIPRNWDRQFKPDSGIMIVDVQLPALNDIPDVESVTYNKSRDEIKEKKLPDKRRREIYDDIVYKMILRTMHEIFEADTIGAIQAATVNGFIDTIDDATGKQTIKTIASVSADKEPFEDVNLERVDPKATFKHFKGVAAAKLADMAPVPPVMQMDKEDKRFIEGKDVAGDLDEGKNVAAMTWQDFEYLIREIFHAEFAKTGGEVNVTQASSDGGVDAIAFDPDPIRGGKIVIQAKRYTNTVGLSAVRDLYGTVLNEGASSGILVTTSDYGKDAYNFAKDKPLKLLNGSNLLHLLEQHGHKARIDLKEARKLAKESV